MNKKNKKLGRLHVISGCMFSGKTKDLIQWQKSIEPFRPTITYKSALDNRYSKNEIVSHQKIRTCSRECPNFDREYCNKNKCYDFMKIKATLLKDLEDIDEAYLESKAIEDIFIDEFHFFAPESYQKLEELVLKGYQIKIAGLNWDFFRNKPFKTMANAMAVANIIRINTADCEHFQSDDADEHEKKSCKNPATKSMWILKELSQQTADYVGGKEKYKSVCLKHYEKYKEIKK